jgi:O-antigen/teichoic acid export membrane protein
LLLHNTLYGAGASVLAQLLSLVTLPLLLNQVGVEAFGVYALAAALVGYFGFLSLLARTSVVRFVAECAECDPQRLSRLVSTAMAINLLVGLFMAGVLLAVAVYVEGLFAVGPQTAPQARVILQAYAVAVLVSQPLTVFGSVLYGLQRYRPIAAMDVVGAGTRTVTVVLIAALDGTILWYVAHELTFELLKAGLLARVVRRQLPGLRLSPRLWGGAELRQLAGYGGWSMLYMLSALAVQQGTRVLVGLVLSAAMVSYLHVAFNLYNLVNTLVSYLRSAVLPSAASALAAGDHQFVERMVHGGTRLTLAVALPVCVHLLVFAGPILGLWLGPSYREHATAASQALVAAWLFGLPSFLLVHAYWAQRHIARLSAVAAALAVMELVLAAVLLPRLGLLGAGLAMLAFTALLGPAELAITGRALGVRLGMLLGRSAARLYLLAAAYGAGLFWLSHRLAEPATLVELVVMLAISTGVWALMGLVLVARPEAVAVMRQLRRDTA